MDTKDISTTLQNLNACLSTLEERCKDGLDGRTLGAGLFGSNKIVAATVYYYKKENQYEIVAGGDRTIVQTKADAARALNNWINGRL